MSKRFYIILVTGILALLYFFYEYKRSQFILSKEITYQKHSIINKFEEEFAKGVLFLPNDTDASDKLRKYFGYGEIIILNKKMELIDFNSIKNGGRCFQDIKEDIILNKLKPNNRVNKNIGRKVISKLKLYSEDRNGNEIIIPSNVNRIYIYSWVMDVGGSYFPSTISFMKYINENSLIICLNTDKVI